MLIPICKNKGDVQRCINYRGIKLISHTMNLWERIVEKILRSDLKFSSQQYGFMPGKALHITAVARPLVTSNLFQEHYLVD